MCIAICTKPLQVLIALNLVEETCLSRLIIVDEFAGAQQLAGNLRIVEDALSIGLVSNRNAAVKAVAELKPKMILIDSDVGVTNYLRLLRLKLACPSMNVYVFEEGIGTYRDDLYGWIKSMVFKMLGVGYRFGGCKLTNGIYVHDKERYDQIFPDLRGKSRKIKNGLAKFIEERSVDINKLFGNPINILDDFQGKNVLLYLSNWDVDKKIINRNAEKFDFVLVKPHPHIKHPLDMGLYPANVKCLDGSVPAELYLIRLSCIARKLHVIHHGSSTVSYINNSNFSNEKL